MFEMPVDIPVTGEITLSIGSYGSDIQVSGIHPMGQGRMTVTATLRDGLIVSAEAGFGHGHRGDEKLLEQRDYRQGLSLINRHNWLTPVAAEIAYARACEELMGLTPPPRALALREFVLSLQNATGWMQLIAGLEQSAAWLIAREKLVELTDAATGARLHVSYIRLGGVAHDIDNSLISHICTEAAELSIPLTNVASAGALAALTHHLGATAERGQAAMDIDGAVSVALPKVVRVPVGQAYAECGATTGTVGVWVHSDGGKSPLRVGLKAPSLLSVAQWSHDAQGTTLQDALLSLLQLPICYGEVER